MALLLKAGRPHRRAGGPGLVLLALLAWLPPGCGAREGPPRQAQVVRVFSGDSVVLASGARVRLVGIDAPAMARDGRPEQFLADRARDYLAGLVLGKMVRLEYDRERYDRYGRLLAYLSLPGGVLVNAALVRQGLARVHLHPPNLRHQEDLLAAQQEARAAGRGLWGQPSPPDQ
ncbi:MAG: thermonuclease family protein [Desulfobaccales bacterium]